MTKKHRGVDSNDNRVGVIAGCQNITWSEVPGGTRGGRFDRITAVSDRF